MSLQTTDDNHVALFENTGDWAFGPIFESRYDAGAFMAWYDHERPHGPRFDALHTEEQRSWYEAWQKRKEANA